MVRSSFCRKVLVLHNVDDTKRRFIGNLLLNRRHGLAAITLGRHALQLRLELVASALDA